mmetsp:Transcript_93630/g.303084  ORF Transcript_93630/g.303084 Transcript_93630/m.303084 type:complete len:604 (-) Transcript_93630:357-2168(-)
MAALRFAESLQHSAGVAEALPQRAAAAAVAAAAASTSRGSRRRMLERSRTRRSNAARYFVAIAVAATVAAAVAASGYKSASFCTLEPQCRQPGCFSGASCSGLPVDARVRAHGFPTSGGARMRSLRMKHLESQQEFDFDEVSSSESSSRPSFPGSEDHDEVAFRAGHAIPQPQRYTTREIFHVLKTWPDSQLWKRISLPVLSFAAWAAFVTAVWHIKRPERMLPLTPHSLLGSALGLLLVYRTNSANDRFWEGRKMWERVVSASRDMISLCSAHWRHLGFDRIRRLGRLLSAFAVSLSEYVVGPGSVRQVLPRWRLLSDEEEAFVAASSCPPSRICQLMLQETMQIPDSQDGLFTNRERGMLNGYVSELQHAVGQGERLVQTPIPQSYVRHTSRFLTLWLATLPFGMCHLIGWWTPAVVWATAWALIGINDLGLGIEHPFDGPQSLRMQVMCSTVHSSVTDALHSVSMPRFSGLRRRFLELDMSSMDDAHAAGEDRAAFASLAQEVVAIDALLGRTALHHAVYNCDEMMVRRLLVTCADVNAVDEWDGSTPLDVAFARNLGVIASCIQQAGGRSRLFSRPGSTEEAASVTSVPWMFTPAKVAA